MDPNPPRLPRKPRPIKVNGWEMHIRVKVEPEIELSNKEIKRNISFCCHVCHRSKEDREFFGNNEYVVADSRNVWHRQCCHNVKQVMKP